MKPASKALSNEVSFIAKNNGAVLIGTTPIYCVEKAIVIGTPFHENWHLSYFFSEARRIREEYRIAKPLLNGIRELLTSEGFTVQKKTPLSIYGDFRPLAVAAGLGHYGRNGLVINKDYSSGLIFSAIFTNAPVEFEAEPDILNCADCELCVRLCPANALAEGRLNYKKCLPYSLRGCSQCMKACGYAVNEIV
ncbi:epoxyqueuosine reductase [Hydrogenispora ethanolica]|uniref:Epoxyqueuosine reductase n=1 Tax=Hydrogenispora ethanolica TaxID=1082276 RepID=A0A4R1R308_HYDET|nr:4Fe-4S ferredoxin [Hydrogenispora ethanolica]TCL59738.1 epoxyqueuosine reductase [Hydrogenispora ethanolica]